MSKRVSNKIKIFISVLKYTVSIELILSADKPEKHLFCSRESFNGVFIIDNI
jgi:hypothetical protein